MAKATGKRIIQLDLYRKVNWNLIPGLGYENVLFIVLYAVIGYHCYHTIGEQYIEAINKAERDGIEIPNTIGYARSAASKFLEEGFEDEKKSSWFNFDLDAPPPPKKEFRLPSQYLPGFWPLLFLGTVAVLHVLIQLLQVWSIKFKCLLHYRLVGSVEDATHVRVIPKANSGKPGLYPIERSSSLGTTFAFHRRRYQWDPRTDVFEKIRCRTDLPLRLFKTAAGHDSPVKLDLARARYGSNKFEMKVPTFKDLYVQQLLSPFTCFQLFCVLLWCLDEYWQYSLFSLFMIFSFEGATVFTRLKNMNLLRGMGNTARPVLVRRAGKWEEATTEALVPGDLFSLRGARRRAPKEGAKEGARGEVEADSDIVPCDCLLLRGAAVLNEATLTGESIPQMKEGLNAFPEEALNVKGAGKVHTLFGGTKILQAEPVPKGGDGGGKDAAAAAAAEGVPDPPDGGCLAYVLRTGFSSSQGKLVRMIEGSTEKVRGDARDTALLLLLLLCFAVGSAAYVLAHGMEDEDRSKYELLLHCILIVTSVVPPELPMQMALAVNTALMTMMKLHIFCTEPFRVPLAGKVDVCLFDKTGTLTTDQLVAVGVATGQEGPVHGKGDAEGAATAVPLAAMTKASPHATLVLGGCQALVVVDGETVGDPIEAAALQAIDWELAPAAAAGRAAVVVRPKPGSQKVSAEVAALMGPLEGLEVVARHHFASRLQRMSTVVRARRGGKAWALVKGSPEAVRGLLRPGGAPAAYEAAAAALAKEGLRLLALALRPLRTAEEVARASSDQAEAERDLEFAGFVAFTCRVRKDTPAIVKKLADGAHSVVMVTGDALLTAVHVAKEVGLTDARKEGILLLGDDGRSWQDYDTGEAVAPADPAAAAALAARYNLATTGPELRGALRRDPAATALLPHIRVFARMTPDEKEALIGTLNTEFGKTTLMCGDGANDVGALKQAAVGVALLGGFGDLNVDRGEDDPLKKARAEKAEKALSAILTPEKLAAIEAMSVRQLKAKLRELGTEPADYEGQLTERRDLVDLYRAKLQKAAVAEADKKERLAKAKMTVQQRRAEVAAKKKEAAAKRQEEIQKEMARLEAQGDGWAAVKASWNVVQREIAQAKEEKKKRTGTQGFTGHAAKLAQMMEEMEGGGGGEDLAAAGDLPMVKVGDASIASPFTSKMPSIKACADIIRQGRCTLVTTIQMYQILALNCLISAYSLSVLYLDGVKYGDHQMTALGMLMSASFISVSRASPLDRLSRVRPFSSIFHPALFLSILGQFALHLAAMVVAVRMAKARDPDYAPNVKGEFEQNLLNSVVFLINAVQQVSVFVVNLKGAPFMNGLLENRPLLYSLGITFVFVFCCASETIPQLNKYLKLEPFPDHTFRNTILGILAGDLICALLWDRLMVLIFAPKVLFASLEGTNAGHVVTALKALVISFAIVYFFSTQDFDEDLHAQEFIDSLKNVTWPGEEPSSVITGSISGVGGATAI